MPRRTGEDPGERRSLRQKLESGEGTQLNVIIPADVHQQLKDCAVVASASMSEPVTEALEAILAEN